MLGKKQQGMGTLFFVFFMFLLAMFVYICWILTPLYIENYSVKNTLKAMPDKNLVSIADSFPRNKEKIQTYLQRTYFINNVYNTTYQSAQIKRSGRQYEILVEYEVEKPLIKNIYLLVRFKESQQLEAS